MRPPYRGIPHASRVPGHRRPSPPSKSLHVPVSSFSLNEPFRPQRHSRADRLDGSPRRRSATAGAILTKSSCGFGLSVRCSLDVIFVSVHSLLTSGSCAICLSRVSVCRPACEYPSSISRSQTPGPLDERNAIITDCPFRGATIPLVSTSSREDRASAGDMP